jgi:uncharacterized protein YbbC (DUF1343 family)
MKSKDFAAYLNARGIMGVRFVPVTFTPTEQLQRTGLPGSEYRLDGS